MRPACAPATRRQPAAQAGDALNCGPEWTDSEWAVVARGLRQQQVLAFLQQLMPQSNWLDAAKENAVAGARETSVTISVNKEATLRHTRIHRQPLNSLAPVISPLTLCYLIFQLPSAAFSR
jgi:hypothetical protein